MKKRGTAVLCGIQIVAIGALFSVSANGNPNAAASTEKKLTAKKVTVRKAKKATRASATLVAATVMAPTSASNPTFSGQTVTANPSQSTATTEAITPSVASPFSARFDTNFSGPTAKLERHTPNSLGANAGNVNFDNSLSGGYKINDALIATAALNFAYTPLINRGEGFDRNDARLLDPALKIMAPSLVSSGPFNLFVDGRVYLPLGDGTLDNHQFLSVRSTQEATYKIGRWTVGAATYARWYGLTDLAADATRNFKLYAGPTVSYQISPNLSGFLLYELAAIHNVRTAWSDWNNGGTDLEPGVSWDISKSVNFSPYLNLYPGGKFLSLDTITANFLATIKFL